MTLQVAMEKLPKMDWNVLYKEWQSSFVSYNNIGDSPYTSLIDLLDLNENLFINSNTKVVSINLTDCKSTMLREAIYLAHKAGALLRSYSRDIESNDQTYAEISAYTASFFLARSITILLGCFMATSKFGKSFWLVDGRNNKGKSSVRMISIGSSSPGHKGTWSLFKHLVVNTTNNPFDKEFNSFVGGMPSEDFAKIRNSIQYTNCSWIYDDLHYFDEDSKDWIEPFSVETYTNADPNDSNGHFSVVLSLMLFRNFDLMLKSICSDNNNILLRERAIILENIQFCDDSLKSNSWIKY